MIRGRVSDPAELETAWSSSKAWPRRAQPDFRNAKTYAIDLELVVGQTETVMCTCAPEPQVAR